MGIAASASASPPPELDAAAPPEPADPPAKEEPRRPDTVADGTAAPAADATGGPGEGAETVVVDVSTAAGGEGEEEGECGFCLFMKGGGCKEEFVAWEKCVEEAEAADGGDVVERCYEVTAALRKCMDAHADYYEPILRAERAMAEDLETMQKASDAAASEATSSSPAPAAEEDGQKKQSAAEEAAPAKESRDLAA
ncbi:hypothetical protein ACP4OV_007663 [Aristida adscensionis]